jgi:hypothetical protein
MKQSILIFVIAWISAVSAFAGVRPSVDPMDGEEFATGEMTAGEPLRIHKLEVPPNVRTVTVHLLIASPNELDLDLYVYDYPPNYEGEVDFDNRTIVDRSGGLRGQGLDAIPASFCVRKRGVNRSEL